MATIRKREGQGGIHYRVEVRLKGAPRQSATFQRLTDAKKWAQATEVAIREGRHFPNRKKRRRLVSELLDRYIEEVLPRRRKQREVPLITAQLRWLGKYLGDYYLTELTPSRIAEVRNRFAAGETPSGQVPSPATCNRYLAVLSHACAIACREWEWLESNPVSKVQRLKEPRGRVRFLAEEEKDRLLEACRASWDPRLYPLVITALATGARQGELLSARWRDADLVRNTLIFHHTKNNERRAVPLTGPALEAIRKAAEEKRPEGEFVFANAQGRANFPRRAWLNALETAEIRDFRFHDLRHSTASYLAMSGATLAEIAEVLGHKTLAMVKRYSHLTEGHTRSVLSRMTARL